MQRNEKILMRNTAVSAYLHLGALVLEPELNLERLQAQLPAQLLPLLIIRVWELLEEPASSIMSNTDEKGKCMCTCITSYSIENLRSDGVMDLRFQLLDLVLGVAVVALLAGPLKAEVLLLQLLPARARSYAALHVVAAGLALHQQLIVVWVVRVTPGCGRLLLLAMVLMLLLVLLHHRELMLPIHHVLHYTLQFQLQVHPKHN